MNEDEILSIATILESTNVLSDADASATVVKVGEDLAVKYGTSVSLLEAQNLEFIAKNSDIPVPKLYGTLTEESTGRNYIIMELVHGQTLAKAWPTLTLAERCDVIAQIKTAMIDLRSIPQAGYIGSIARHGCADGVFYLPDRLRSAAMSGPFDTEDEINQGILQKLDSSEQSSYI